VPRKKKNHKRKKQSLPIKTENGGAKFLFHTQNSEPQMSASTETKLSTICSERDGLRNEVISYAKSMHQAMFAFLTAAITFAGIYLNPSFIKDEHTRSVLMFLITQVEFFLALFVIGIQHCAMVASAYIEALEYKINKLSEDTVSIWQSKVVRAYVRSSGSAFSISFKFFVLVLLAFFGISLVLGLNKAQEEVLAPMPNWVTESIGGIEAVIIFLLLFLSGKQRAASYKLARAEFEK
jgi:hypothetical protein